MAKPQDTGLAEMLDAAKWQIERAGKEDDLLYRDLAKGPIDEVMVHRLVQSVIQNHEQSRMPKRRGRPSQTERDHFIRFWVDVLQDQCGLDPGAAHKAIGNKIALSPEAIRSIVRAGKK